MDQQLQKNVLQYIETTQAVLEKTAESTSAYVKEIPAVVDQLIASELVPEENREKLASALKDPLKALECISTICKRATEDTSLGTVVDNPSPVAQMDAFQRWMAFGDPNATGPKA